MRWTTTCHSKRQENKNSSTRKYIARRIRFSLTTTVRTSIAFHIVDAIFSTRCSVDSRELFFCFYFIAFLLAFVDLSTLLCTAERFLSRMHCIYSHTHTQTAMFSPPTHKQIAASGFNVKMDTTFWWRSLVFPLFFRFHQTRCVTECTQIVCLCVCVRAQNAHILCTTPGALPTPTKSGVCIENHWT